MKLLSLLAILPSLAAAATVPSRALALAHSARQLTSTASSSGIISVTDSSGNALGYVGSALNDFGEFGLTNDSTGALAVSFSPGEPFAIAATGTPGGFAYLAGVSGYSNESPVDDLQTGSFNYAYLAASSAVPAGPTQNASNSFSAAAGTSQNAQTTFWSIDPVTQSLTAQWVNADSTVFNTTLAYDPSTEALLFLGDVAQFASVFEAPTLISFVFVSQPGSS